MDLVEPRAVAEVEACDRVDRRVVVLFGRQVARTQRHEHRRERLVGGVVGGNVAGKHGPKLALRVAAVREPGEDGAITFGQQRIDAR